MELEKDWPKTWEDVQKAGVLPGVDESSYTRRYPENFRASVRPFLLGQRGPVVTTEAIAEVHRRQFDASHRGLVNGREQATIGEFRGSPEHRTSLELRLLEDQTRRLLKQIDPARP